MVETQNPNNTTALVVEGVTRCGGLLQSGTQCPTVHGGKAASSVDGSTYTVRFTHALVRDGVISPICSICMIRSLGQAIPLEEAPAVAAAQITELERKLARARNPHAAPPPPPVSFPEPVARTAVSEPVVERKPVRQPPPPVVPPVSRVPAVRKDEPKREAKRSESRKEPQPLRERRPTKADKATARHLADLRKATAFNEVFVERKGGCSFKACTGQHGKGFITKPFEAGIFPVCDPGLRAARAFKREREAQGNRAPFLVFNGVEEHKRFVAQMQERDARDARMATAILERRFTSSSMPQCCLIGCERPGKPADHIEVDGRKAGDPKSTVGLCHECGRAARRLRDELREAGQPLFFRFTGGKKRGERPAPVREERPASTLKGTMRDQLQRLIDKVPPKAPTPAPAAETPKPDTSEGDVGTN